MKIKRLDRIRAEAQQLRFDRAILTLALGPLYLTGWLAGKGWQVIAFSFAALKVGWHEGSR